MYTNYNLLVDSKNIFLTLKIGSIFFPENINKISMIEIYHIILP